VAHPGAFERKVTEDFREVGCPVSLEEVEKGFRVLLAERTRRIAKDAYFLTGLERKHEDPGTVVFHIKNGKREPDPVLDDSSLVLKTERGLFIVCGCAHSGLLNIVDEAVDLLGDEIYGLAGGFHLVHASGKRIGSLIARLKELKVKKVYPCHCTGIRATYLMQSGLRAEKVGSGDVIRI
jgi:7,8-dihydropterin-6-yl-methyl-4-(beta-D-ribofuranosyl)aminobenzene 5'-phosphate synthase